LEILASLDLLILDALCGSLRRQFSWAVIFLAASVLKDLLGRNCLEDVFVEVDPSVRGIDSETLPLSSSSPVGEGLALAVLTLLSRGCLMSLEGFEVLLLNFLLSLEIRNLVLKVLEASLQILNVLQVLLVLVPQLLTILLHLIKD
jgi:hypothetical protein